MAIELTPRRVLFALAATAWLCVLAYWRTLGLPLISDDYVQIQLARQYGPVSGWAALAADPLYRCRATSLLLTHWTERLFGLTTIAFYLSSLAIHILNTWLVLALGAWKRIGWRVALPAACFFAVYEGHQEAVIWYAALPELLVFTFCLATLLLWVGWLQDERRAEWRYAAALACFLLALLSKESAVAAVPLLALAAGRPSYLPRLAPFAALSAAYFGMVYLARNNHLFFHDGTFSLHGPFWIVLPVSMGRLLWIWGVLALAALAFWRAREWRGVVATAAVWIPVTLLPYSFLTYMPRVPSRHTYLASAGLALLVGAAFLKTMEKTAGRRWVGGALALVIVGVQCGYLWTRKHDQFLERAAPTERLLRMAASGHPVVRVRCFPYSRDIAQSALEVHALRHVQLVFDTDTRRAPAAPSADFCTD